MRFWEDIYPNQTILYYYLSIYLNIQLALSMLSKTVSRNWQCAWRPWVQMLLAVLRPVSSRNHAALYKPFPTDIHKTFFMNCYRHILLKFVIFLSFLRKKKSFLQINKCHIRIKNTQKYHIFYCTHYINTIQYCRLTKYFFLDQN